MGLFELIRHQFKIVSIVGMAKNAGKTVTLNHLIETTEGPIGLTSIGRDGERQDIVTKTDKPMVFVTRGTYVATAEMLFHLSEAKMEVIEVTKHETAMGRVIIGRTMHDGFVQIGGPSTNSAIREVSEKMIAYGAKYVFVDGALDRTSSASPAITEACVLATGAVLSRDMQKTVAQTVHRASLFHLKQDPSSVVKEAFAAMEKDRCVCLIDEAATIKPLSEIKTALSAGREIARALEENTRYVLFPGAMVYNTVLDIVQTTPHYKHLTFVVVDATKIFIEHRDWQYLMRIGVKVAVLHEMNLVAISVNPYAPTGYYYQSEAFVQALKKELPSTPIVDVMEGV